MIHATGAGRGFGLAYTDEETSIAVSNFSILEAAIGLQLDTQIHELGNSIRYLTGVDVGDPNNKIDKDSGHRLVGCVSNKLLTAAKGKM